MRKNPPCDSSSWNLRFLAALGFWLAGISFALCGISAAGAYSDSEGRGPPTTPSSHLILGKPEPKVAPLISATAGWTIVNSPDVGAWQELRSVACISTSECWAVGYYHYSGSDGSYYSNTPDQTLILRWNGTSWSVVTSPNSSPTQANQLSSVTCASTSQCWAVGNYQSGGTTQTLIEEWNGTSWSIVSSANASGELNSVACSSTSQCWAVGDVSIGSGRQTVIEQWNGTSWSVVSSPNFYLIQVLEGVTCASASDCWAVGFEGSSPAQTIIYHWDGTSWTFTGSPNTSTTANNTLNAVTCSSSTDCWAVGYSYTLTPQHALIAHWNGTSWSLVSSNTSMTEPNRLNAVACVSATNCQAIGGGGAGSQALIEKWNGTTWSVITPANITQPNGLSGISCTSASNCWAAGIYQNTSGFNQALIEHWDGTSWSVTNLNVSAPQSNYLQGMTCTSPSECSAVGYFYNGYGYQQTLAARWDGSAWRIFDSGNISPMQDSMLKSVACTSGDCWAVGQYISSQTQTLIKRSSNLGIWTVVTSPNAGGASGLDGVACPSSTECWAVGYYVNSGFLKALVEHWDGNSWSVFSSPDPSINANAFNGVACASTSECWAVGYYVAGNGAARSLIEYWDGNSWSLVNSPNASAADNYLEGVTCSSASNCWAVGYYINGGIN
ncbi:MAG: hypothetical protein QOF93_755, partial [Verrucomicrobiota bacterium]